jgi:hypothetical protein
VADSPDRKTARSLTTFRGVEPLYFAMGTRSGELLGRLKGWMRRHNAVILAVVLLVIGVTLIGDGIGGLAS